MTCTYPIWRSYDEKRLFDENSKLGCFLLVQDVMAPIHLCGFDIVSLPIVYNYFEALNCCEICTRSSGKT